MKIIFTDKSEEKSQDDKLVAENLNVSSGEKLAEYWNAFNPNPTRKMKSVPDDYVLHVVEEQAEKSHTTKSDEMKSQMKMSNAHFELTESELSQIMTADEFKNKHLFSKYRFENNKRIDGERFWISCVTEDCLGNIKGQLPLEVATVVGEDKEIGIFLVIGGIQTNVRLFLHDLIFNDGVGHGVNFSKTIRQAQYMYNKDIMNMLSKMDSKIETINDSKRELMNLELTID